MFNKVFLNRKDGFIVSFRIAQMIAKCGKLHDIGLGNDFMDMTPKAQATRTKINKCNYIRTAKETIIAVER